MKPSRRRLALHEAGHVAMALILGARMHRVTLRPNATQGAHAVITTGAPSAHVLVALSGDAAERIAYRSPGTGARADYRAACEVVRKQAVGAFLRVARALLRLHWPGVLALTDALVAGGRLTGAEAREVFQRGLGRKRRA